MGKKFLSLMMAMVLLLSVRFVDAAEMNGVYQINVSGYNDYTKAYEVMELVNKERAKEGLKPVVMDKDLLKAAMGRAAEIAFYFDHTRPNGKDCFSISPKAFGENIQAGTVDSKSAMEAWMNSDGHRANILTKDYVSIGVGCFEHDGIFYWVQLFGLNAVDKIAKAPSDINTKVTFDIKKNWASFAVKEDLPEKISVGETAKIKLETKNRGWEYAYFNVDMDSFDWSSTNTDVAKVNGKGEVTAIGDGETVISAKYKGTKDVAFSWKVTCGASEYSFSVADTLFMFNADVEKEELKLSKGRIKSIKKAGKKQVNLKLKKINNAIFYEIKYFAKGNSSKSFKVSVNDLNVIIGKLKKNKKYQFKVRGFAIETDGDKVYGEWSEKKGIKL